MGVSAISEKITGLLLNNKIQIASIQRDIVWNEGKIKKFCEQLLEKPLFLSSVYCKLTMDDFDFEVPEIYDGLQRISTLLIICNLLYKENPKTFNEYKPAKMVFSNEKRQLEWDNVIYEINNENYEIINSQVYKNYKVIEKFYNDLDFKDKEIFIKNFKSSTWYFLCIPKDEDANEFYINVNSKGTLMRDKDIIRGFYADDDSKKSYERYNSLLNLIDGRYHKKFLQDVCKNISTKPTNENTEQYLDFYENSENKPTLSELENYSKCYSKMLTYSKYLMSRNFPTFVRIYLMNLENSNLLEIEKDKLRKITMYFLHLTIPLSRELGNGKFFSIVSPKFRTIKTHFSEESLKNVIHSIFDECKKYIKNPIDEIRKHYETTVDFYKLKHRELVNLLKLLDDLKYGQSYHRNDINWSIEHIVPQDTKLPWINDLGNLCLMDLRNNQKLGGSKKKENIDEEMYINSGCRLTKYSFEFLKDNNFTETACDSLKNEFVGLIVDYIKDISNYKDE